jgi:hypothetical protein
VGGSFDQSPIWLRCRLGKVGSAGDAKLVVNPGLNLHTIEQVGDDHDLASPFN